MKSSHLQKRDDAVFSALDDTPHLSTREIGQRVGLDTRQGRRLVHLSLKRLESAGLVTRGDEAGILSWSVQPTTTDAAGEAQE